MLKYSQCKRHIHEIDIDYTGEFFTNGRRKPTVNQKYARALNINTGQDERKHS